MIRYCEHCGSVINCREHAMGGAAKYCNSSCAASKNNTSFPKRKPRKIDYCVRCGSTCKPSAKKFCSPECFSLYHHETKVNAWLDPDNPETGLQTIGTVKAFVKRWLRETRGNFCELCGWAKVNPHTGKIPLTADHVDGDWRNNIPENLRLLCGACDSLQPTYKGANVGKGRPWRMELYYE